MQLSPHQIQFFQDKGYLLVSDVFSNEEIERFRLGCINDAPGDSVGRAEFNQVSISPSVISIMKQLLGEHIIYPGLSLTRGNDPVHQRSRGARIFHTDATNDDFDYSSEYLIFNTGIYLQDHSKHSGGLKVKVGSHKFRCIEFHTLTEYFRKIARALVKLNFADLGLLLTPRQTVNIPSKPGDLIIFNTRTHHSGHAIRLKWFPNLSLPPVLENHIPSWMTLPIDRARCVILTIYAAPCKYLEGYIAAQIRKQTRKAHYLSSPLDRTDIRTAAQKVGIELRNDGFDFYKDSSP